MTEQQHADVAAERALLGSLLIDPLALEQVAQVVGVDDFTRPAGRHLFAAMLRLRETGRRVDYVTVCGALEDAGLLKRIGEANVTSLVNYAPTSLHALTYARRVAEKGRERRGEDLVEPAPLPAPVPTTSLADELFGQDSTDDEAW